MIRILIVDDEKTIREGLFKAVPWEEHGYTVVSTAKNGEEALDFFQNNYADIVISDIKMPKIDGLTLQKKLREKYPHIPFVFISGYEDFKYVKEALRQGASSYLLKPIDINELLSELERTCEEQELHIENVPLKELISRNLFSFGRKWDFTNYEYLKEDCDNSYFCAINIRCDHDDMMSRLFFLSFRKNIQDKVISAFSSKQVVFVEASHRGIIYCIKDDSQLTLRKKLTTFANNLENVLNEYSSSNFGVWTGGIYKGVESFLDSYAECFEDENFRFGIREDASTVPLAVDFYNFLFTKEDEIISLLLSRNFEEVTKILLTQMDYIRENKVTPDDVRLYFRHLICRYIMYLKQSDNDIIVPLELQNKSVFKGLTTEEIFDKVIFFIEELYTLSKPISLSQSESYIAKVKDYIDENYSDPYLTLTLIANYIALNPSYLCTEFAKQEGIGIIQYLTKLRMKKAKDLLLNSSLKINDISNQVGYLNSTYFSTIFRKQEGKTPSEFRKN